MGMRLHLMSLHGGILIAVILLLRALCKNRLPKNTFLVLWGVALLRLLIPFSIPARFSIYSYIGRQEVWENYGVDADAVIGSGWQKIAENCLASYQGEIPGPLPCGGMDLDFIIAAVRWGGTVLCALLFFALYHICMRRFCCSLPVKNEYVRRWVSEHRLRRSLSVRQSDRVSTPLTYGTLNPVILLPQELEQLEEEKMEYILQHEYRHIRRFDGIWKLLMVPAACLHWFNPLVWIMYFALSRDIELACDESVLRHFGTAAKRQYARILLEMSEEKQLYKPLYNAFGRNATEERIRAIMKYKKKTFAAILTAITLVTMVACGFATSQQPQETDRDTAYGKVRNENNPTGTDTEEQLTEMLSESNGNGTETPSDVTNNISAFIQGADPTDTEIREWISVDTLDIPEQTTPDGVIPPQTITIYVPKGQEDIWSLTVGEEEYQLYISEPEAK